MSHKSDISGSRLAGRKHSSPRTYDPIVSARNESPALNKLFLKNGESQTLVQKVGFTALSLMMLGMGLRLATDSVASVRDGDVGTIMFLAPLSAFSIVLGVLALSNALRFKS